MDLKTILDPLDGLKEQAFEEGTKLTYLIDVFRKRNGDYNPTIDVVGSVDSDRGVPLPYAKALRLARTIDPQVGGNPRFQQLLKQLTANTPEQVAQSNEHPNWNRAPRTWHKPSV
jgi:hypothetical protein